MTETKNAPGDSGAASRWMLAVGQLLLVLVALAVGYAVGAREQWWPLASPKKTADDHAGHSHGDEHDGHDHAAHDHGPTDRIKLTDEARANLGVRSKVVKTSDFWKTLTIPGTVIDRPGVSDRGVTAPAIAVVTAIRARPGDTVKPLTPLFGLRLTSEYVQTSQSELYKNARELQLAAEQRDRLRGAEGAVAEKVLLDADQQLRRLQAVNEALRQDLTVRGLSREQIDGVLQGKFVRELEVRAPAAPPRAAVEGTPEPAAEFAFELQDLKVGVGEQVQAGQTLAVLSNHAELLIEGHAFRADLPLVERAARERFPVEVEFVQTAAGDWPDDKSELLVSHLANAIDPATRTASFYLPLANRSRTFERAGKPVLVWRYLPGQRVRLRVKVEKMEDVIVLPPEAVTFDGPEAFVFRQNGDVFQRVGVHVVYADATAVAIANDGQVGPGQFLAQRGAAALNRAVKAAAAGDKGGGHEGHDHEH